MCMCVYVCVHVWVCSTVCVQCVLMCSLYLYFEVYTYGYSLFPPIDRGRLAFLLVCIQVCETLCG